ncbi:hypothetical protein [Halorussus sp. AFM4]|uniref:hypothetical protein n=1 Tax=Halorussus sp. AFM4 TaxID=3421651 RepID=UPI003EC034E4
MVNTIKNPSDGLALQVTEPARKAGLVEENDGETMRRADARVYSFEGLLLVVDREEIDEAHIVELVKAAAGDTKTVRQAIDGKVQTARHGYQIQLPPARDAGFREGDPVPCHPAPNMLVISKRSLWDEEHGEDEPGRIAASLLTIRRDQVGQTTF